MKSFTSIVKIQYSGNQHLAKSKEEYIKLLKAEYIDYYNIELEDHEITEVEELVVGEEELGNDVAKALGHMNMDGTYITAPKLIDNEILSENGNWK